MMKNLSRLLSDEIRTNNVTNPWPPTPQDILNDIPWKMAILQSNSMDIWLQRTI